MSFVNYNYHATYEDFKRNFYKTDNTQQIDIPFQSLVVILFFLKLPFQYRTLPNNITKSQINYHKTLNFSKSILELILKVDNNNFFRKSIEYDLAETTFKTAYSNFIGTTIAAYIAMAKYGIEFPYHISDNEYFTFQNYSRAGSLKSKPDLFGVENNTGYIFEAKGSTSYEYGDIHGQVKNGRKQKRRISWVKSKTNEMTYRNNRLKRRVISTSFNKSNQLQIHDIDPDPEVTISYDENLAIFDYYRNLYYYLKEDVQDEKEIITVKNEQFILTSIGEYKIGLLYSVFKDLDSYSSQYKNRDNSKLDKSNSEDDNLYKFIQVKVQKFNAENETIHKMRNIDIDSRLYYLLNGVVTYHEKDKNKLVDIGQLVL